MGQELSRQLSRVSTRRRSGSSDSTDSSKSSRGSWAARLRSGNRNKSQNDLKSWARVKPKRKRISKYYELGDKLGAGATAVVRFAICKMTGKEFAVKVFQRKQMDALDVRCLFEEVTILSHLDHPHIVKLHEFYEEAEAYHVVMEYVQGPELFIKLINKAVYTEGMVRDLFRLLAEALCYLHERGVVHRDLKLENLLLRDPNDDVTVVLVDFGFACHITERPNGISAVCGTPGYMAPEVLKGQNYGQAADMWSLGVITYILIGGFAPFGFYTNLDELIAAIQKGTYQYSRCPHIWDKVSEEAKDLIARLLHTEPEHRITARDALKHRWLSQSDEDLSVPLSETQSELRKFNARRKLRAAFFSIVAANRMANLLKKPHLKPNNYTPAHCLANLREMAAAEAEEPRDDPPPPERPRVEDLLMKPLPSLGNRSSNGSHGSRASFGSLGRRRSGSLDGSRHGDVDVRRVQVSLQRVEVEETFQRSVG